MQGAAVPKGEGRAQVGEGGNCSRAQQCPGGKSWCCGGNLPGCPCGTSLPGQSGQPADQMRQLHQITICCFACTAAQMRLPPSACTHVQPHFPFVYTLSGARLPRAHSHLICVLHAWHSFPRAGAQHTSWDNVQAWLLPCCCPHTCVARKKPTCVRLMHTRRPVFHLVAVHKDDALHPQREQHVQEQDLVCPNDALLVGLQQGREKQGE